MEVYLQPLSCLGLTQTQLSCTPSAFHLRLWSVDPHLAMDQYRPYITFLGDELWTSIDQLISTLPFMFCFDVSSRCLWSCAKDHQWQQQGANDHRPLDVAVVKSEANVGHETSWNILVPSHTPGIQGCAIINNRWTMSKHIKTIKNRYRNSLKDVSSLMKQWLTCDAGVGVPTWWVGSGQRRTQNSPVRMIEGDSIQKK